MKNTSRNVFVFITKSIIIKIFIFIFLLAPFILSQSQLSLTDLINKAIKKNADMLFAKTEVNISELNRKKALSAILPNINFEGGYIYTKVKNGIPLFVGANGENEKIAGLSINQPIFNPNNIYNLKASNIDVDKQNLIRNETKQNIIQSVIDTYFNVLKYKGEKRILNENIKAFELLYQQSKILFESGNVPEIDVKKSKVELLLQKNILRRAEKNYTSSLNNLKLLIGLSFNDPLNIKDFKINTVKLQSLTAYINYAWQNRPDWQILKLDEKLSDIKKTTAFMKNLPNISANLFYGWDVNGTLNNSNLGLQAVVSVSMPLWHWGGVKAGYQIAEIQQEQTSLAIKKLKFQIQHQITDSYNEAKLQKEQIAAMLESTSEAKTAVKMAKLGYTEGTITNLEFINTQKLLLQSEMEYQKALYNFYSAKAALFKNLGKLKEDLSWLEQ